MHHCASIALNEPWALSIAGSIAGTMQGGASKCDSLLNCVAHLWMRQQLPKAEFTMRPHEDLSNRLATNQDMTETTSDSKRKSETAHASMGVQV